MATATAEPALERQDVHEARFRVMGTDAHLIVVGGAPDLLEHAARRLQEFEARWTRFDPTSELCRLNASSGVPVLVSDDTFALITHACEAWRRTGGAFDPTVLPALEAAGYDRDFDTIMGDDLREPVGSGPAPGCADIALDPVVRAVRLPAGVRLDLGGIGKGFAADLLVAELVQAGVAGACVNLGGDLRATGEAPSGVGWAVEIEIPDIVGAAAPVLTLADGAVATTTRCRRVWRRGSALQHHVIDPRTGSPAITRWISVTVVAGRAVDAEPLAKAALLSSSSTTQTVLRDQGACGLLVDASGHLHPTPGIDAFLAAPPRGQVARAAISI